MTCDENCNCVDEEDDFDHQQSADVIEIDLTFGGHVPGFQFSSLNKSFTSSCGE